MKKQVVIYQLVLDRSGSMQDIASESVSGFNEQVQRIRELSEHYPEQDIRINLCLFNHVIRQELKNASPGLLAELTVKTYNPNGMTALYDAVGQSIRQVKKLKENRQYKVYFVILTDGHENSSTSYTYEEVRRSIERLENRGKWQFSYLGSTLDAVEIARSLNISEDNAICFKKENVKDAMEKSSKLLTSFIIEPDNDEND